MVPGYLESAPLWRRRLATFTCSLYRLVICVNPEIRGALLSRGVKVQRTEVLPAFLSTGSPQGSPTPELRAWIERHRPLFSTVLFFRPEYGFDLLVSGLARLSRRHPSLGCIVMGSGEQLTEAKRRVSEAGLEGNVLLLGDVDHDSCLAMISACDVFLRTTLQDGDSISVREALSLGVPVVASRVGTRPDGAILFHPGNVEEMLVKIELALAMKRSNRSQMAGCMDRLMEIYRELDDSEGSLCLN
jgi:glycosyltransferase involved in cell wall biosynthesis